MMLSNSFPVRDMAMFGGVASHQFVNRGAAGIDGITSTAWGIHQSSGLPTACITGDLAFLHDSNALLSIKQTDRPFLIIVINNGGVNIFRMLPVYQQKDIYETYFETPQQADIISLVKSYGISTRYIDAIDEMKNFDLQEHLSQSESMLSVVECKTDADASMKLRNQLWNFQI
jgi:2-succinyl-5-enolpyruvyl-6-hydroxy-3-cyclohexene-1-carboxylate synthase